MTEPMVDYLAIVRAALAEAVGVDESEVEPTVTILGDLGAESIDLLDTLFRIERLTGVKIQATDIADRLQGELGDDEFEGPDGTVTAAGLNQMRLVLPQIDVSELAGRLRADDIMSLFTVQNLADLAAERADALANATADVAADAG